VSQSLRNLSPADPLAAEPSVLVTVNSTNDAGEIFQMPVQNFTVIKLRGAYVTTTEAESDGRRALGGRNGKYQLNRNRMGGGRCVLGIVLLLIIPVV
jgi:hypothetical protein